MKASNKLRVLFIVVFVLIGLAAVSFFTVLLFRKSTRENLGHIKYTKILEMESGLVPEKKLAMQLAQSPLVVDYMENPSDPLIFGSAIRDFKTFQDSFSSHRTFWISDKDLKYYSNMNFVYLLDKSDPGNAWYQATIDANLPFQFYVDYDIGLKKTFMWINVLVYNEAKKVVGITGTGVELNDFVDAMYKSLDEGVTMYMYNSNGEISASLNLDDLENKVPVTTAMPDLKEAKTIFPNGDIYLSSVRGEYLIAPVESLGWEMVLFVPFTAKAFLKNAVVPFSVFILLGAILLIAYSVISLLRPLDEVQNTVENVVSGEADLTRRLSTNINTPFKSIHSIVAYLNEFMQRLQNMLGTIKKSSANLDVVSTNMKESVASVSDSMTSIRLSIENVQTQIQNQTEGFDEAASAVKGVASSIDSQTASIRESAASVEQLIHSIEQISGSMESMAESFGLLDSEAQNGMSKQQKVNERIMQIETQSKMLQEANMAIASIAGQTNLLAMNAAIEAAHAGEAGKGFAVVADEIRKLSETSSGQSKTIGNQLKNIKNSIGEIVAASQESSSAFSGVSNRIRETDALVQSIRTSLEAQNENSRTVIASLSGMDKNTENVRSASMQMESGSSRVLEEMGKLQDSLDAVRQSMEAMSENAQSVVKSGMRLDGSVEELDKNVTQLGADVNRFKTE